ncbi:hypothetical protein ACWDFL_09890 [Streptomyces bungoensis]
MVRLADRPSEVTLEVETAWSGARWTGTGRTTGCWCWCWTPGTRTPSEPPAAAGGAVDRDRSNDRLRVLVLDAGDAYAF